MNGQPKVVLRATLLLAGIGAAAWALRPDPALVLAVVRDPQGVVDAGGADDVFLVVAQVAFMVIAGWLMVAVSLIACAALAQRPQLLNVSMRLAPTSLRNALAVLLGVSAFALTACARTSQPQELPPTTAPAYAASSDAFDWPASDPGPSPTAPAESASPSAPATADSTGGANTATPSGPAESASPSAPATADSTGSAGTADSTGGAGQQTPGPSEQAAPTTTTAPASSSSGTAANGEQVTVQAGDCLWSIAMQQLGAEATLAAIADHVDALYTANADAIGPNPDLLRPGLTLHVPTPSLPTI